MYYYLNYFFIFSIFDHLLESVIFKIFDWNLKSGFLYGLWTPVYGYGVILIIIISHLIFRKLKINKFFEVIIFFIIVSLLLSFIEFIGGHFLHLIFHKNFWNYSNHKYHIGRYISIEMTFVWGICSLIFLYFIKPWMDKVVNKIPKLITIILVILFVVDNIATFLLKA